jgi:mRNA-degrading endonuclease RelE of RelBE toxin-antitoxin system
MAEPRIRTVVQAPRFGRSKKRLPAAAQLQIDEAVKGLLADPLSGEPKTGALKGVRVSKFKVGPQQLLLAYQFDAKRNVIEVLDVGPHENFYRELQKYLDAR